MTSPKLPVTFIFGLRYLGCKHNSIESSKSLTHGAIQTLSLLRAPCLDVSSGQALQVSFPDLYLPAPKNTHHSGAITRQVNEQTCSQNTVAVCSPTGSKIVTSKSIKRASLKPEGSETDGESVSDMDFEFVRSGGTKKVVGEFKLSTT
jgi:hypothetical protein